MNDKKDLIQNDDAVPSMVQGEQLSAEPTEGHDIFVPNENDEDVHNDFFMDAIFRQIVESTALRDHERNNDNNNNSTDVIEEEPPHKKAKTHNDPTSQIETKQVAVDILGDPIPVHVLDKIHWDSKATDPKINFGFVWQNRNGISGLVRIYTPAFWNLFIKPVFQDEKELTEVDKTEYLNLDPYHHHFKLENRLVITKSEYMYSKTIKDVFPISKADKITLLFDAPSLGEWPADLPAVFEESGQDVPPGTIITIVKSTGSYIIGRVIINAENYLVTSLQVWNNTKAWVTPDGRTLDREEYPHLQKKGIHFYLPTNNNDNTETLLLLTPYQTFWKPLVKNENYEEEVVAFEISPLSKKKNFKEDDKFVYAHLGISVPQEVLDTPGTKLTNSTKNVSYLSRTSSKGIRQKCKVCKPEVYEKMELVYEDPNAKEPVPVSLEDCKKLIPDQETLQVNGLEVVTLGAFKSRRNDEKKARKARLKIVGHAQQEQLRLQLAIFGLLCSPQNTLNRQQSNERNKLLGKTLEEHNLVRNMINIPKTEYPYTKKSVYKLQQDDANNKPNYQNPLTGEQISSDAVKENQKKQFQCQLEQISLLCQWADSLKETDNATDPCVDVMSIFYNAKLKPLQKRESELSENLPFEKIDHGVRLFKQVETKYTDANTNQLANLAQNLLNKMNS